MKSYECMMDNENNGSVRPDIKFRIRPGTRLDVKTGHEGSDKAEERRIGRM